MAAWLIPAAMAAAQGVGNVLQSQADLESAKAYRDAMSGQLDANSQLSAQNLTDTTNMWNPLTGYAQQGASGLSGWSSPTMGQFGYDKSVQSFLDPSIKYQTGQAADAIQSASGPVALSGSALRSLNQKSTDIAGLGYQNAQAAMQQDKNFAYTQFLNDFNSRHQQALDQYNQLQSLLQTGTGAMSNIQNARTSNMQNQMDINSTRGNLQGNVAATRAGLGNRMVAGLLGSASQGAGVGLAAQQYQDLLNSPQNPRTFDATGTGTRYGVNGQPLQPAQSNYVPDSSYWGPQTSSQTYLQPSQGNLVPSVNAPTQQQMTPPAFSPVQQLNPMQQMPQPYPGYGPYYR